MKLTWLGHAAFRAEIGKATILIDPFFDGNPSFSGDKSEAMEGCTHIVLTHGHADHLGNTIEIAQTTGATVVANADLAGWLANRGVANVDPANTGGTVHHEGFSVTFVIAQHSSSFMSEDGVSHSLGSANGVIIKSDGEKALYHMGDTDIFGDMALIEEFHRPKIGIVPIGDRFTMNGEVAAMACKRYFDFDVIIPCHYGSFPIIEQTPVKFLKAMGEQDSKVRVPSVGEALDL